MLHRYVYTQLVMGPVAALAIDKLGPTIFVRALPLALPLGQEAKKVKSPWTWSIVLLC